MGKSPNNGGKKVFKSSDILEHDEDISLRENVTSDRKRETKAQLAKTYFVNVYEYRTNV